MDFTNPYAILSSLVIGFLGLGLFLYGRKAENPRFLGVGILMSVASMALGSVGLMWAAAGLCLLLLFVSSKFS